MATTTFNYYGMTDEGKEKELNEDFFHGLIHKNVLFLIVADGLGGKEGLDLASIVAINEMQRFIERNLENDKIEHLKKIIEQGMFWINRILLTYKRANEQVFSGFGTTFTICAVNQNKDVVIGHAGNTRMYLFRNNAIVPMTKDHTEAQLLFDQKKITKEELRVHPERATLTKALGEWENLECDIFGGKLEKNDIILLCSDGAYNMLTDDEISSIIFEAGESKVTCEWLIEGANRRGGVDNIVVLISYINF
ncbi:MAG: protein phosphatase 2C domain-containing protein [Candidatus Pacebacteria bacterium]|nr:protein phosphatase 2C domain-containing protein [Candidatus Paceibacterota bacterium]